MRMVDNRAKLPKESPMAILIDTAELDAEAPEKVAARKVPVLGSLKTELRIQHRHVPLANIERFVDGWTSGKRNEVFGQGSYYKTQPLDIDWQYGYQLARQNKLYFTQALHSWIIWSLGADAEVISAASG